MEHISEFTVHKFRGLRELNLTKLGQINLLIGNNNSGKTSVLEAFSLFSDPLNESRWYESGSQRELPAALRSSVVDRISWLFPQGIDYKNDQSSESSQISISALGNSPIEQVSATYEKFNEIVNVPYLRSSSKSEDSVEDREVEAEGVKVHVNVKESTRNQLSLFEDGFSTIETLSFTDVLPVRTSRKRRPTIPTQIVNPISHRANSLTFALWSEVIEADLKENTIKLLRFFDPAIEEIDFISPTERRQLISVKHAKLGRAPLSTFGDGLRRVFTFATTIPRIRGGFLLVDELETAIHTKALEKTFEWLINACIQNKVQLVATTHSLEALDAILEVSRERADFVIYRLQQDKEQTTATRFDQEMTLRLRQELGMEMRY
jgi:AAA15 family ATPase/GTPase